MAERGSKEPDRGNLEAEASSSKAPMSASKSKVELPRQALSQGDAPRLRRYRRPFLCCGVTLALVAAFVTVIVILLFTYFKAKHPKIHVTRVVLENFNLGLSYPFGVPSFNVTLGLDISVHNPNHASFKYHNSTSYLIYHGTEVGEAPIPAGRIAARGTECLMTTVSIMADRVLTDQHLFPDLASGVFPLTASAEVTGRVNVLNVFKHRAHSSTCCNMSISVAGRFVENVTCIYRLGL